ncbi:hypothetical protein [Mycolicibacterium iranicum]|uniref:hypothetical protein n=1 Tax=Mycolicibacterium iranicum TaxID=912594 RepID=UPI0004639CBD|nr:hypothetical protein [Mycolicibacterium iranicum]
MMTQTQCKNCTVPTSAGSDVCGFCATYTPPASPAQQLDVAVNRIDLLRADGNAVLRELPQTAPLFAAVDLVRALGHLRMASVLIDGVSDALESAGVK